DVENRFGLVRIEDEQFFSEWCDELPSLTETDKKNLDVLRRRYIYHRADGNLLEGTVMLLLVSPLLAASGFYDSPFWIKAEKSVNLTVDDGFYKF
ncbi:MAG: type I restriction endonuclease subunit R, partial [Cyanobacteria bacterium J06636_27]